MNRIRPTNYIWRTWLGWYPVTGVVKPAFGALYFLAGYCRLADGTRAPYDTNPERWVFEDEGER